MSNRLTIAKAYERVNEAWPDEVPALSAEEATKAARRLYRWATGETWYGPEIVTSGNRYSGLVYHDGLKSLIVNPERGWKSLVHHLSHSFYWAANPGEKPHSKDHARLEKNMIKEVLRRGWLDGGLRTEEKPKPSKVEELEKRLVALDSLIEGWERKAKRATNALVVLHARRKQIVKKLEREESGHASVPAGG